MQNNTVSPYTEIEKLFTSRDYTEYQIVQKMNRKGYSEEIQQQVIQRLYKVGALNDKRYVEHFIETSIRQQSNGPWKISMQLQKRGVDKNTIAKFIEKLYTKEREQENAKIVIAKRSLHRSPAKNIDSAKRKASDMQFLASRGFSSDVIYNLNETET